MTESVAAETQFGQLQQEIETARGYERLLKAKLAALQAGPSIEDLGAAITTLELEKVELTDRLEGLRSGKIKPVPLAETEAADKAWAVWKRKSESRRRIFVELWAVVVDGLPEELTKEGLWYPPRESFPLTSSSPPEKYMSNVTQHDRFARDPSGPIESRANGVPAYGNTNGSMPVPNAPLAFTNGDTPHRMGALPFNTARSPPNAKSTSHVPCKFFRLGQCQAGKACPFSHSTDITSADTPCKYFAKGNCKFGSKCALAHILPNGRRVNRPSNAMGGPLKLGGRVDPQIYHPDSALANSLLAQQAHGDSPTFGLQYSQLPETDHSTPPALPGRGYESNTLVDNGFGHANSKYGSPRDDARLLLSPANQFSTLDAPMPASFDSQGISYIARHGPVAASVPSKFGLESPPSSLPKKVGNPSSTLLNLHNSAFGQETRSNVSNLGSSPLGSGDENYSRRPLHSLRVPNPSMVSASVPRGRANEEWDGILFGGEEDFLPTSLHDLLTPQEKMRRLSRTEQDERPLRESLSGTGTPADSSSHVGSPSHASPSRFSAFFVKQQRDDQNSHNVSNPASFGHVGSPLRHSSMHLGRSPSLRTTSNPSRSGDASPYVASPPRQSSMSIISQQLARTRISSKNDVGFGESIGSTTLHPNSALIGNQPSTSTARLDRSTSASNTNIHKIEGEHGEGVFAMEDEEEEIQKRRHGESAWNYQQATEAKPGRSQSPGLGAIGAGRNQRAREAEKIAKEYWT
ncbi:MAG: hypothetical protein LQ341_003104 [Variospora aurantia]|nr:MAG: hypothetical protein LQ341_003104 [Variospora aurantia]